MWNVFSPDSELGSLLNKLWDLLILNLLAILCCIPVVTIGSSMTALSSTCLQMQEGQVPVCKTYFHAFCANFKQSTVTWIMMFLILQLILINYAILLKTQPVWRADAEIVLLILAVLTVMSMKWSFGLQAYFENDIRQTAKNSVLLSLAYLFYSLAIIALDCIPVVLFLLVDSNVAFFMVLLYGVSIPGYISSLLMKKAFLKLQKQQENKPE